MEQLKSAAAGWSYYIQNGKYPVLLLAILIYLWYQSKGTKNSKVRWLLGFATLSTVLVILPVTSSLLMRYQTPFYDYGWLWALVPITLVIAYGGTHIYNTCYAKYWKGKPFKITAGIALGLAVLILSGNLSGNLWVEEKNAYYKAEADITVDYLTQNGNNTNILLWAPQEVMENVRILNGNVRILYGRDMWEESLRGYTYDTYEPEIYALYQWMESITEGNISSIEAVEACLEVARNYGVNTILLPNTVSDEVLNCFKDWSYEMEEYRGYYIYRLEA